MKFVMHILGVNLKWLILLSKLKTKDRAGKPRQRETKGNKKAAITKESVN